MHLFMHFRDLWSTFAQCDKKRVYDVSVVSETRTPTLLRAAFERNVAKNAEEKSGN